MSIIFAYKYSKSTVLIDDSNLPKFFLSGVKKKAVALLSDYPLYHNHNDLEVLNVIPLSLSWIV